MYQQNLFLPDIGKKRENRGPTQQGKGEGGGGEDGHISVYLLRGDYMPHPSTIVWNTTDPSLQSNLGENSRTETEVILLPMVVVFLMGFVIFYRRCV